MPAVSNPQQPRYAIQKARGKGWSTLEVGDALPQAEARFRLMVSVNPRAYFRLIQLDYNQDSDYAGTEFNWKLLQLHDPRQGTGGAGTPPANRPNTPKGSGKASTASSRGPRPPGMTRGRRRPERVRLPWRVYTAVIILGLVAGAAAYLLLSTPAPSP